MRRLVSLSLVLLPAAVAAQNRSPSQQGSAVRVGPEHGTVIVVGGGAMGPEIYQAFIKAAGGPDALIVDVPTADGDTAYTPDWSGTRGWIRAGAKHVVVLHTTDRKLADSDSFAAVLKHAGGVWFEGGRQFHLVDSYAGTKTETAIPRRAGPWRRGRRLVGRRVDTRRLPGARRAVEQQPDHGRPALREGLRLPARRRHRPARGRPRAARRSRRLDRPEIPEPPGHLRGRRNGLGRSAATPRRIIGRNKAFVYNSGIRRTRAAVRHAASGRQLQPRHAPGDPSRGDESATVDELRRLAVQASTSTPRPAVPPCSWHSMAACW